MTKSKTLEQLRAEKERAETQLAQEKHKLNRLENRKKYLEKGERQKRTHRLCNLGGTIESLAPEVKDLTRTEMTELMEYIFSLSEVQRAVRHMAITHTNQANREKELMHISYKPLWHTLLERDMRKEDLRLAAGMTTNMIANMSKEGKHISMDTLARICETLNCEITDVIELVPDEPASTGGKEHERIETKNNRKRN